MFANKKYRLVGIILILAVLFVLPQAIRADTDIKERFEGRTSLSYQVFFNGIPVGNIEWRYLGKEKSSGKESDVLYVSSDTDIVRLLNLESKEKVYLDSLTHLPIKVTREIYLFSRREHIEEIYNQDKGYVKIIKRNSKTKVDLLHQEKPIHNILALLYFFPRSLDLVPGTALIFNLPTSKVKIKVDSLKTISFRNEKRQTYFLVGRGERKFNLWLDKDHRLPLRLEFLLPVGKVVIVKKST